MIDRFHELDQDFHKSNFRLDPVTKEKIYSLDHEYPENIDDKQKDLILRVLGDNMPPQGINAPKRNKGKDGGKVVEILMK